MPPNWRSLTLDLLLELLPGTRWIPIGDHGQYINYDDGLVISVDKKWSRLEPVGHHTGHLGYVCTVSVFLRSALLCSREHPVLRDALRDALRGALVELDKNATELSNMLAGIDHEPGVEPVVSVPPLL